MVDFELWYGRGQRFVAWLGRFLTWALPRLAVIAPSLSAMIGVHALSISLGAGEQQAAFNAVSFELAYVALALVLLEDPEEIRKGQYIRYGTVAASIVIQVTEQMLRLRPWLLDPAAAAGAIQHSLWFDGFLSLLIGVPIPLIGFFMSGLILHPPKGLSREALQKHWDAAKDKIAELELKLTTALDALSTLDDWRARASTAENALQYSETLRGVIEEDRDSLRNEVAALASRPAEAPPAQVEEKKLTPKMALRKLRSSGLTLRDLAKAAVEAAGDEKVAAKELGLTLAQVRSLTKEA